MQFKDIIGHQDAIDALREMIHNDKIPHAILLSGIPGIGKMRLARAFVQYLYCENRHDGDSCGKCKSCLRIQKFTEPDLHYVFPIIKKEKSKITVSDDILEIWTKMISDFSYMPLPEWQRLIEAGNSKPTIYVNESERIAQVAALSSYAAKYKTFLIWLPERLQPEAANKLLKLIEEPFEDTLFIAVSNDPGAILPTVFSRMRRIELRRPDDSLIVKALTDIGEQPSRAKDIARLAAGNVNKAFEMANQTGENAEFGDAFRNAMRMAYACKVDVLRSLADRFNDMGREKAIRLLEYFSAMVRENFIANLRMPVLNNMNSLEEAFAQKFAPFIHEGIVEKILEEIDAAARDIARNANGKLVWFDFLLQLMTLIRTPKPKE